MKKSQRRFEYFICRCYSGLVGAYDEAHAIRLVKKMYPDFAEVITVKEVPRWCYDAEYRPLTQM